MMHENNQNPFQRLESMFDHLAASGPLPPEWRASVGHQSLAVDVSEDEDTVHVTADVPGASEDDITITVEDQTVTISVDTKSETDEQDATLVHRERYQTSIERRIRLPAPVDAESAEATYTNGVLSIALPKDEVASGVHIDIE